MNNSCLKNVPNETSTNLFGNKPRINFYKACLENSVNYKRATGKDYVRVERPTEEVNEEVKETKTKTKK
jgi:hypothetical protein